MWSIHCCAGVLLIFLLRQSAGIGSSKDRTRLYNDLLTGYQKNVAPDGQDSGPVVVLHTLIIERVISLNDGILTLEAWEGIKWNDNRLEWNHTKYNNISSLSLPSSLLWQPDVLLADSTEEYTGFASGDVNAVVYENGSVYFMPPRITKSVCYFDEDALYAKNEVSCTMKYMSWTRDASSMDIRLDGQPKVVFNTNPNWNVVNSSAVRNELTYSCCPSPYVDVQYKLNLKRIK